MPAFEIAQNTPPAGFGAFFEALDGVKQDANFALSRLAALSTGLPTVLRAAGTTATAVANISSALGFATGALNDAKRFYLLADFKPQLYKNRPIFRKAQESVVLKAVADASSPHEAKLYPVGGVIGAQKFGAD